VPLIITAPVGALRDRGELSDLVPTALAFLGLRQPAEMTGSTLLVENVPEL
jgi:bisphosphoglycerate-independent phosphoglycerate mutase (AlkP superfamily)